LELENLEENLKSSVNTGKEAEIDFIDEI